MYLDSLAMYLCNNDDWYGYDLRDLRRAIDSALVTTLDVTPGDDLSQYAFWINQCKPQVDFALYLFGTQQTLGLYDKPEDSIEEALGKMYDVVSLDRYSKRNLFVAYLNSYFYKYIKTVELNNLHAILERNGDFGVEFCVDFFITTVLYASELEEFQKTHPGKGVTYKQFGNISPERKEALSRISESMVAALRKSDERAQFENVFLLMTYYVGSNYRRVHNALTAILNIQTADFRQLFYDNLDRIIQNEGNIQLGGFYAD
jgi:hypothetical protein